MHILKSFTLCILLCTTLEAVEVHYKKPKGFTHWEAHCFYLAHRQKKIVKQLLKERPPFPLSNPNYFKEQLEQRIDAFTTFLFLKWIPFIRKNILQMQLASNVPFSLETKLFIYRQEHGIDFDETYFICDYSLDLLHYVSSPYFKVKIAAKELKEIMKRFIIQSYDKQDRQTLLTTLCKKIFNKRQ